MTVLVGSALVLAVVAGARGTWSPCGLSMLSAINPMSEAGRGHRYFLTCAWFITGALLGGVVLGAGAAALSVPIGLVSTRVLVAVGSATALVTLASDLRLGGFSLPLRPRQVDETWFGAYRRWVYAAGFGAQIGVGFATYLMTAATYLVAVLAALTGSPWWALAVGALFGTVRGLAVLVSASARSPEQLRVLHRRLAALDPWSLRLAMAAQGVVAVVLGIAAAGTAGGLAALLIAAAIAARPVTKRSPSTA